MKNSAAMFTVLATAGIFWALMIVARQSPNIRPQTSAVRSDLNQKLKSAVHEMDHLKMLSHTLDVINAMNSTSRPTLMVLAENMEQSDLSVVDKEMAGKKVPTADPSISLIYISPDMQKVVIDGRFFGTGDTLPDGARLTSITEEGIVLMQHGRRKVIPLAKRNMPGTIH